MTNKEKARELRRKERLSLDEIQKRLKKPRSTITYWVKDIPLTKEELRIRRRAAAKKTNKKKRKGALHYRKKLLSPYYTSIIKKRLDTINVAKISEAAVLFKLTLHGFNSFSPNFDGEKADFLVLNEFNKTIKVQVKSTQHPKEGLPRIDVTCCNGRRRRKYAKDEFDILVGYDIRTDTCYIFRRQDIKDRGNICIDKESEEAWERINKVP
jgi:hypothetical protein